MKKILLFLLLGLLPQLIHAQTAKAIWCSGNTTLYFTYDTNTYAAGGTYEGQRITEVYTIPLNGFGNNRYSSDDYNSVPWFSTIRQSITKVEIASNFIGFTPTSLSNFWYAFSNLTTVTGSEYINTSNVKYMQRMFSACVNLTSLDVSSWDVSNVIDMRGAFFGCRSLTSLDVGNWNVSKVTDMRETFRACASLTSLDVSNWDVSKVVYMSDMFYECSSIISLDVSRWNVGEVLRTDRLFGRCKGLTSLNVSNWDVGKVQWMNSMFSECTGLTSLDVSRWNVSSTTQMNGVFQYCSNIPSLDVSNWDVSNVDRMGTMFDGCTILSGLDVSKWNVGKVYDMVMMFRGCRNLSSLDVSNWNVGTVWRTTDMFQYCSNLSSLDVSRWNVSNVLYMDGMFNGCTILSELDVSEWNVGKVTTMEELFSSCRALTSLDVSKWNTENVTNMNAIFSNCVQLTSLDVSNWDVSKVTDMRQMFVYCSRLLSLDVSRWNTRSATMMNIIFSNCRSLTHLTFGKDFSMDNVPDNYRKDMFRGANLLRYIDFFDSDNTDAITLADIDRVLTSNRMFSGVPATTVIYLPHGSQYVTDAQNVVYSYNGDETDLRCLEYYSEDKVDIEFPRDFKTHKAIYQRTMSNNYGSVILPYDFTTNDKVQAYTLDEEHTETMYFRDTQTVPAHTPFAFNVKQKGSGNVVDFTMTDSSNSFGITVNATHTTHPDEKGWDGVAGAPYSSNTNLAGWTAKGYYVNQTIEKTDPLYSDLHYIAGEKFYKAAGETLKFPPHRVTFHGTWAKGNTSGGAKSFVFAASDDEVVTAIEEAETRQTLRDAEAIYDLAGRRQHEAQKGVNIVRMKDGSVRKMFVK